MSRNYIVYIGEEDGVWFTICRYPETIIINGTSKQEVEDKMKDKLVRTVDPNIISWGNEDVFVKPLEVTFVPVCSICGSTNITINWVRRECPQDESRIKGYSCRICNNYMVNEEEDVDCEINA